MRILIDLQSVQTQSGLRGIGRYSLSLARAMAEEAGGHRFEVLLNGAFAKDLGDVRRRVAEFIDPKLIHVWQPPVPFDSLDVSSAWRRAAALSLRRFVVDAIAPDAVHLTSLFEDVYCANAVTAVSPVTTAVTFYDLIPLLNPTPYLSDTLVRRAYEAQLAQLRRADLLLAISEHARREALGALDLPTDRVVAVSGDADPVFRRVVVTAEKMAELQARWGIRRGFVLFAGGAEPRKNLDALIEAYGRLPGSLRQRHQLVVVAGLSDEQRYRLAAQCRRFGIAEDDVRVTGRVDDETLVLFYNACRLFVFPSLHEGFGLPVLEAMRCGAAVIASNRTSIPEVLGREDALFDPASPLAIAQTLERALTDEGWLADLKRQSAQQAQAFSWRASARRALAAIEAAHDRKAAEAAHITPAAGGALPRLAVVGPATLAKSLPWLAGLSRDYVVDIVDAPGEHDRVLYLVDDETMPSVEQLSARPGCVLLLALPQAREQAGRTAELYAFGGWRAIGEGLQNGQSSRVDPAIVPVLRAAQGVIIAAPRIADSLAERFVIDPALMTRLPAGPDAAAGLVTAIESFARSHPLLRRQTLIAEIAAIPTKPGPTPADRAALAVAIHSAMPAVKQRQLLIDVSMLVVNDRRTGIERVVRAMLLALVSEVPLNWRVEPVRREGDGYLYARRFMANLVGAADIDLPDAPVDAGSGDIFLDLEFSLAAVQREAQLAESGMGWLTYHRLRGMKVYFGIHDILPIQLPQFFNPHIRELFETWLKTLPRLADGLVAVSRTVRDDLEDLLLRTSDSAVPRLGYFHHGADIEASGPSRGIGEADRANLAGLAARPTFLMVGTVEGRKGHAQVLEAMEILWQQGVDAGLLIIGQSGWDTESFCAGLKSHAEQGKRLVWLDGASDDVLAMAYQASAALVMASQGEGFGLPLIEAARHGLPIISRDLPVFREVAGDHARYFSGLGPEDLAAALATWLDDRRAGAVPTSQDMPVLTWRQSARMLLNWMIEGEGVEADPSADDLRMTV